MKNASSIRRTLADKAAGQTVPVLVIRDKRSMTLAEVLPLVRDWGEWISLQKEVDESSAALLASDLRSGRPIFWTIEYDAEGDAINADDLERGLRDRCFYLVRGAKLIAHQVGAATRGAC